MNGAEAAGTLAAARSVADRLGSEQAEWMLLEHGGHECPACSQAERLTRHWVEVFGARLCSVCRHFPLVQVRPHAARAAEAAEAAAAQGRFWPMPELAVRTDRLAGMAMPDPKPASHPGSGSGRASGAEKPTKSRCAVGSVIAESRRCRSSPARRVAGRVTGQVA